MIIAEKTKEQLQLEIESLQHRLSLYEHLLEEGLPISNVGSSVLVRAFYLSSASMVIFSKHDGCLLEVNHGFCRVTGYRPEEIIGHKIDDIALFVDLDGNPLVNQLGMGNEIEAQYRTRSGEYRVAMLALEEFSHQGITYRLASFADITPRKLMEVELRKSKEQLQQIISASPAPICVSTLDEGRYLDVNESFLRVTGYSRDQVIGKTIEDINFLVGLKRKFYVDKLLAGETVNNLGIVVKNKSGEIGYSLLSAQVYMVDDLPCVLSTVIDITERKLTEQALAESEARFHSAFHFSPTMMIITRADNGKIIDANNAWLQTMGYNLAEVDGRNVAELNAWVDDDRYHIVRCIEETGRLDTTEVRVRTASGQILYTLTSAVQTSVNNELCVLTYSVDITEQKRIQKELARLDRLNLVGQMAASLGHEVRNPMTTVRGFLQILQDQEGNLENQEYYQLMIEELDQGNRIISEYLALASDKKVDLRHSNLNNILEQIYPLLRAEALLQEKWINYHLGDIPELLLDEKEIRQLIINIANNGLESMAPGGCLEVYTTMEKERVVLGIVDQGQGIAPSLVDRLGTPFLTTKKNGVGLGLAICYSIAQRHGASIDFASHERGTTFRISFRPI